MTGSSTLTPKNDFFLNSTSNSNLRLHKKNVHEGLKVHKCVYCNKDFSQLVALKVHINRLHEQKEKDEKCHLCDSAFKMKYDLERHIAGVHNKNPYKCDFCSKTFGFKGNLDKHMDRMHKKSEKRKM